MKTLVQFSLQTLEMCGFSPFNHRFSDIYLTFQTPFMITFELFILFDTFYFSISGNTYSKRQINLSNFG